MALNLGKRFSYANVAATAAVVIAIGGGGAATAAALVANNSVGSPQIINGAVRTADLHPNAVTSSKVKDGTLGSADLTDNSVAGADLKNGSVTGADVADGSLKHGDFTSDPIGIVQGYAWNNLASPTLGVPQTLTNSYTYNSKGGDITLTRSATGVYTVNFEGLSFYPGNVQVSAYGGLAHICGVGSWGSSATSVYCYDAAGNPVDSLFTVAVIK